MYICKGNRTYSDIFCLIDSHYKQTLTDTLVKIGHFGFMYPMIEVTALNR